VILDSSALVAVLLREPGWQGLLGRIAADEAAAVGTTTLAETGLVLTARLGRDARRLLSAFVREAGITVLPFVEEHARVAVEAYVRYGKGRHPAALSFGDCLTYAVARLAGQPLLCVGNDFPRTDLPIA
jgi:ribonuclease VapC